MQEPKKYSIKPSGIAGVGLGLYLEEPAKKDERIAIYSGVVLDKFARLRFKQRLHTCSANIEKCLFGCKGRWVYECTGGR